MKGCKVKLTVIIDFKVISVIFYPKIVSVFWDYRCNLPTRINYCAKFEYITSKYEKYEKGVHVTSNKIDFDRFKVYLTVTFAFKITCVCQDSWCNLHRIYTCTNVIIVQNMITLWSKQWDMRLCYEPLTGFRYMYMRPWSLTSRP